MYNEVLLDDDMIIVSETDQSGRIVYVNDDFCKMCGFSKDELIGKPHNIVRHKDMPRIAFKGLWESIQKPEIWNGIVKNKTKNDDFYWVNATVFPSKTIDGQVRYVSVRVKPTKEEVETASQLYKKLLQGE